VRGKATRWGALNASVEPACRSLRPGACREIGYAEPGRPRPPRRSAARVEG